MLLTVPEGMTHESLGLDGRLSLLAPDKDKGIYSYTWALGSDETTLAIDEKKHTIEIPDDAPAAQVAALQAAIAGFGVEPGRYAAGRLIFEAARSSVGRLPAELSGKQIDDLVLLLLWEKKALADDGTIRPPEEWIVRVPPPAPAARARK